MRMWARRAANKESVGMRLLLVAVVAFAVGSAANAATGYESELDYVELLA